MQSSSDGIFPGHVLCLMLPLSILLYLFLVLNGLLLANALGHSMLLSGAMSPGDLLPFLVCSKLAPSPTPDASVSKYSGLVSL